MERKKHPIYNPRASLFFENSFDLLIELMERLSVMG
jgi:hypothetical protein